MKTITKTIILIGTLISVAESFTLTVSPSCFSTPLCGIKKQHKTIGTYLMAQKTVDDKSDFWESQKILAESMSEFADNDESEEEGNGATKLSEKEKYNKTVNSLVSETFYFGVLFFSAIWLVAPNPFTAISYFLGALLGTAYCYGLGKYVQTLGGSAYDMEDVKGSGVGSARFAFLIVLFIFVGKFRSEGLQEIPAIMGFFTYQLSTLSQGLKESTE